MSRRNVLTVVAGALVAAALGAVFASSYRDSPSERSGSETDLGAARNLEEVVGWADVIVTGTFLGDTREVVELPSPVDGEVNSSRVEQVMRFRLTQVLRSDRALDDEFIVRSTVSLAVWDDDRSRGTQEEFGPLPLNPGNHYALFLTRFSESTGDELGPAGPVAVAEIVNGRLHFLIADRALDDHSPRPPLLTDSPSLDDVTRAASAPKPTPVPLSVDASSPAVVYGARMTIFADRLQSARTREQVDEILTELDFGPGKIDDPVVCRKLESALQTEGWPTDLQCP